MLDGLPGYANRLNFGLKATKLLKLTVIRYVKNTGGFPKVVYEYPTKALYRPARI